jgi:predicted nucleotidyltransferase
MKPPDPIVVEAAVRRITRKLVEWGATRVILFGSVARGDYTASSDIDLLIVKETPERIPQRIADALDRCSEADPPLPVEPLVYTPAEFDRLVADENPLVQAALVHGRVLHDQA